MRQRGLNRKNLTLDSTEPTQNLQEGDQRDTQGPKNPKTTRDVTVRASKGPILIQAMELTVKYSRNRSKISIIPTFS